MNKINKVKFEKIIRELEGKECWGFVAGTGTGSVVSLKIGNKIPRKKTINNTHLSKEVRENDGEYVLFIKCVWRLETKKKVICGAWDDNSKNGTMLKGLQQIVEHKIIFINLEQPGLDLKIEFDNGVILRIFCDSTNSVDKNDNYCLFINTENTAYSVYSVTYKSSLIFELCED